MKSILVLAACLLSAPSWAYTVVTYNRAAAPMQLVQDQDGNVEMKCTNGSRPFGIGQDANFGPDVQFVNSVPTGGSVGQTNDNCTGAVAIELWLTRANQSRFLAYKRNCPDNAAEAPGFINGGRVYQTGNAADDKKIADGILAIWSKIDYFQHLFAYQCQN